MKTRKRIVVIGAGYGGILTTKMLSNKLKNNAEITLIDRNQYHTMLTELHEVAACRVPEHAIKISLSKVFFGRPVSVVQDTITRIDPEEKAVYSETERYEYDYLVVGTGSRPTYFGIPGADTHCFPLWAYEDAVKIRDHILRCFREASNSPDMEQRRKLLSFVVVGGGFTGIEMVGELAEWCKRLRVEFNIPKNDIVIRVVDFLPSILPNYPKGLIRKAENRLKKLGVEIVTGTAVKEVTEDSVTLGEKGSFPTCTVIWAAGIEGSTVVKDSGLKQEGRHRLDANQYLQEVSYDSIYVVGDAIFYKPDPNGPPVPQMVENAEHSASLVSGNIVRSIHSQPLKPYKPSFHGSMVSIGGAYGVAQIGTGNFWVPLTGFFALFVKHFINLIYFMQVAGFNKCWSYSMHEFFHAPDRRTLLGGHFTKASPNFWLVPLRLFVGGIWVVEAWQKIEKLLADPTAIFLIPAAPIANAVSSATPTAANTMTQAAPVAADAVSSATPYTASAAASTLHGNSPLILPVPEFIRGTTQWFMNTFFYASDGSYTFLAHLFQAAMIFGELAVGLCLFAGFLTAPAALGSILLCLMIWSSGMSDTSMLWYFFAGFALIGGSGSTFGMDYYIYPYAKKLWKKIPFIRRFYFFID